MAERIGRCRLRSLLRVRKIRQVRFAEMVGMTKQQVNDYVNGRSIMTLETARRVAQALDCTIDDLYDWVEDNEPSR